VHPLRTPDEAIQVIILRCGDLYINSLLVTIMASYHHSQKYPSMFFTAVNLVIIVLTLLNVLHLSQGSWWI
jgi:hypothetical protein